MKKTTTSSRVRPHDPAVAFETTGFPSMNRTTTCFARADEVLGTSLQRIQPLRFEIRGLLHEECLEIIAS